MKSVFSILLLLVSLQVFSNTIESQDVNVVDEISYCIDIDVGEALSVETLNVELSTVEKTSNEAYAISYNTQAVETPNLSMYLRALKKEGKLRTLIPSNHYTAHYQIRTKNMFRASGGLADWRNQPKL